MHVAALTAGLFSQAQVRQVPTTRVGISSFAFHMLLLFTDKCVRAF